MTTILARSKNLHAFVNALLLGFVFIFLPVIVNHGTKLSAQFAMAIAAGFTGVVYWANAVQRRRQVEIDTVRSQVSVHNVSIFFAPRVIRYPLETFGSVRSYLIFGRSSHNAVELVTKPGGEALLLAEFSPGNGARSFWSLPRDVEHIEAGQLRREIAAKSGLADLGFLGQRMVGAQLRDH